MGKAIPRLSDPLKVGFPPPKAARFDMQVRSITSAAGTISFATPGHEQSQR
jgi:hypothetical protein